MLHEIDLYLMKEVQSRRCPHCEGPLHLAKYSRKAAGVLVDLPEEYRYRYSLCCGSPECRKRTLPPSGLFMDRKASYRCAILVGLTVWQSGQKSAQALSELLGVDVRTIFRWAKYFREVYPRSSIWQRLRGRVPTEVQDDCLPGSLVQTFVAHARDGVNGVIACIRFLIGVPEHVNRW
jgi:hypothetical protein